MMLSSRCVMHVLRTRTTKNLNLFKFCSTVDGSEEKPPTADKHEEELIRSQRYEAAFKTLAPVVIGMYIGDYSSACKFLVPALFYQNWIKEDSTGIGAWLQNKGPQKAFEKGKQAWDSWNPDVRKIVAGGIMEGALKKAVEESGLKDLVDGFEEPYATIAKVSIEIAQKGVRHTITSYMVDDGVKLRMDTMEKKLEDMMTIIKQQQEEIRILNAVSKKKESDDVVSEDSLGSDDQGVEEDAVGAKEVMDDSVVEEDAVGAKEVMDDSSVVVEEVGAKEVMDDSVVEEVADYEHVVSTREIVVVGKQEEEE